MHSNHPGDMCLCLSCCGGLSAPTRKETDLLASFFESGLITR